MTQFFTWSWHGYILTFGKGLGTSVYPCHVGQACLPQSSKLSGDFEAQQANYVNIEMIFMSRDK